jgi:hypothetical protein
MSGEDFKIQHNGVEMNYSAYVKMNRLNTGTNKFNKLVEKYGLTEIENNNNIMSFLYKDETHYYALVKQKIRKKGSKDWFTKVTEILK